MDKPSQRVLQPPQWPRPRGYANGVVAEGETIFLAGQVGWDAEAHFAEGFPGQVHQALNNIATLLAQAGAEPRHIVRLTWFVTDLRKYRENLKQIGEAYREVMGKHFPAMSVIGISQLVEAQALVEIEATAVLPRSQTPRSAK
jgi:enamine deaminase RidA (YjgF/YER057c/UK114 family)